MARIYHASISFLMFFSWKTDSYFHINVHLNIQPVKRFFLYFQRKFVLSLLFLLFHQHQLPRLYLIPYL